LTSSWQKVDLPTAFGPHTMILGDFFVDIVSSASNHETGCIVLAVGVGDWKRIWKVFGFLVTTKFEFAGGANRFSAKGHSRETFSIPDSMALRMIIERSDAVFFDFRPFITGNE